MNKEYRLTKEGRQELEDELAELVGRRGEIAEKLKTAREHGDLRENAEYHNARDEQGAMEARIAQIEGILKNSEVMTKEASNGTVSLGATVVLKGQKGEQSYTIVGSVEANPLESKISDQSPIGQALMGKSVGDEVTIVLPAGQMKYKIKTVS